MANSFPGYINFINSELMAVRSGKWNLGCSYTDSIELTDFKACVLDLVWARTKRILGMKSIEQVVWPKPNNSGDIIVHWSSHDISSLDRMVIPDLTSGFHKQLV